LHGEVAPEELFGAVVDRTARDADIADWLREDEFAAAETGHGQEHEHHDVNRHDDHIRAFCLYHDEPVSLSGLMVWLNMLASLRGANLLRVKGLINVDGAPIAVHAVQTIIHEPVQLARWPDEERRSRLVFITRDMERVEVERTLSAFQLRTGGVQQGNAIDPQAYAQFLAVAGNFR